MNTATSMKYEQIDVDSLSATDLRERAIAGVGGNDAIPPQGTTMACLSFTTYDAEDCAVNNGTAVVLYEDGGYRIGIVSGQIGDADWGDVYTDAQGNDDPAFWTAVESAILDWMEGGDAWESRN